MRPSSPTASSSGGWILLLRFVFVGFMLILLSINFRFSTTMRHIEPEHEAANLPWEQQVRAKPKKAARAAPPPRQETTKLSSTGGATEPVPKQPAARTVDVSTVATATTTPNDDPTTTWDRSIKSWGCNRTDTPLVFIHIGKAGGGGVRARIAASALDYNRNGSWARSYFDDSYYPMVTRHNQQPVRGGFCNYCFTNPWPEHKTHPCNASTPLGQAVACPMPDVLYGVPECCQNGVNNTSCEHTAYVGHNFVGTELHWLPTSYFVDWWKEMGDDRIDPDDQRKVAELLEDRSAPCAPIEGRTKIKYKMRHANCGAKKEAPADEAAQRAYKSILGTTNDWSALYSSLPVLRVTVTREPFPWLLSRFFWHSHQKYLDCHDLEGAVGGPGARETHRSVHEFIRQGNEVTSKGWAQRLALFYTLQLCGYDCIVRLHNGEIRSLEELERQADGNLRRSFAVVGLLKETDTFYDMLTRRVDYIDTSYNPEVTGGKHTSKQSYNGTYEFCKNLWYKNTTWQQQLLDHSPEITMLNRLWQTAQEVNRFQLNELQQCGTNA